MSFTSEDGGGLQTPLLEEELTGDDGNWAEEAEAPTPKFELGHSRSSKMSFSGWSDDVGRRRRSEYMKDLILRRQLAMRNLFEGIDRDEEEGDVQDSTSKISIEMQSAFVRHLQSYVEDNDVFVMPTVDIRVKNFSFEVPISKKEAEGKIKIPTLFNYSLFYWCKKAGEMLMRRKKNESAIRRKEVKSVLSNVNLALKPGKMYLVIGPPLSGKTSLLKGEKLFLYFLPLDLSELMLTNSLPLPLSQFRSRSYWWQASRQSA